MASGSMRYGSGMTRGRARVCLTGIALGLLLLAGVAVGCHRSSRRTVHRVHGSGVAADDATVQHRFEDAEAWASRFEDPARDGWQRPDRVIALLDLEPTSRVADIGAATGYFPLRLARAIPDGTVYGVDIEPTLVNYLNLRARREGTCNLVGLVCAADDPRLPEPVDRVLLVNTFHHIDGRVGYFSRLKDSLRADARVVVVDFHDRPLPVGPSADHKISARQVISEMDAAGYELEQQEDLPYQYVLVFRPR